MTTEIVVPQTRGNSPGTMTPKMVHGPRVPASLVMSRLSLLPAFRNLPTTSSESAKTISVGERLILLVVSYFGGAQSLECSLLSAVAGGGGGSPQAYVGVRLHLISEAAATWTQKKACVGPWHINTVLSTLIQPSFSLYLLSSLSGRAFYYFQSLFVFLNTPFILDGYHSPSFFQVLLYHTLSLRNSLVSIYPTSILNHKNDEGTNHRSSRAALLFARLCAAVSQ